jgi:Ca2+/H+ antiporter, TMEM165/GDT1 family
VDPALIATVFAVIFAAELPDKTALASLVLGSRYRPSYVFAGVAGAFAVHVALAVACGGLIGLLPQRPLKFAAAALFLAGSLLMLRGRKDDAARDPGLRGRRGGFWRVASTSFAVIMVAEFGDLTQVLTATLAASDHHPLAVGVGALAALWAVAAVAVCGGRGLLRVIPMTWITRCAAAVMLVLAGFSLVAALS